MNVCTNRIAPKGIDVNKTSESCSCIFCSYYVLKVNFRFQPKACDGCHYLLQVVVASVTVNGNDYRIHF